ncbi:MAG: nucleotidyltransferase family protein [Bacteroidales bacterium]|nr:nucleotidyltransferase family protein [Bacteroidales bacterium]
MQAIILAGGLGTRLRGIIKDVPKPMAPINNKPFLYYVFKWLEKYPVDKVILSTGYKSESISDYFGTSLNNIIIDYVHEEQPLGTGGAIKYALSKTSEENILVLNGDTYFPVNLNTFYKVHISNKSTLTIALKRMKNFSRYGTVECRKNSVIKFNEKKYCADGLINGGIYLINRNIFESEEMPEAFSFEKEILEKEDASYKITGYAFNNLFIDIGVPEDYSRAKLILAKVE